MGVSGLLEFVRKRYPDAVGVLHMGSLPVLVDDAMTWLYAPGTGEGALVTPLAVLNTLTRKVRAYLRTNPGGVYVLLFDGGPSPAQKGKERERRTAAYMRQCELHGTDSSYPEESTMCDQGLCLEGVPQPFDPRRLMFTRAGRQTLLQYLRDNVGRDMPYLDCVGTLVFDAPTVDQPLEFDTLDGSVTPLPHFRPDMMLGEADRRAAFHVRWWHDHGRSPVGVCTADQDALKYAVHHVLAHGGNVCWLNNSARVDASLVAARLPFRSPRTWLLFCACLGTDFTNKSDLAHYVHVDRIHDSLVHGEALFGHLPTAEFVVSALRAVHMDFFLGHDPHRNAEDVSEPKVAWAAALHKGANKPRPLEPATVESLGWLIDEYWGLGDYARALEEPAPPAPETADAPEPAPETVPEEPAPETVPEEPAPETAEPPEEPAAPASPSRKRSREE